ncbi:tRNA 2-selenouridine(34) synthase MnmH [Clostridium grantii]|nr:tRNA 2-selenouridine(34) synthase MnmH [Clostridium grantii]
MYQSIEYKDIKSNYLIVDVRSPLEYKESTINGAINIPIFDDDERCEIGTVYVNESKEKAKKIGVKYASNKLPFIYEEMLKYKNQYEKIVLFCARGGMRSTIISGFLNSMGLNVIKLEGGYKSYRNYVINELITLNENKNYIVLHGNTGVGKTEILKNLKNKGYSILDLEGAANHRGSMLGHVGLGNTNNQKQFESNIFHQLQESKDDYIFIEAESSRIGSANVPKYILNKMKEGFHIYVDAPLEFRVNLIVDEYMKAENAKNEIIECLTKFSKYISKEDIELYRELLMKDEFAKVTKELMVKYYDPLYMKSAKRYLFELKIFSQNIEEAVSMIEKEYLNRWHKVEA